MAKDSKDKSVSRGQKRKSGDKSNAPSSPKKRSKVPKDGSIPHTVSRAPLSPATRNSATTAATPKVLASSTEKSTPFLPRPFPSFLSNSEPPLIRRMVSPVSVADVNSTKSKMAVGKERSTVHRVRVPYKPDSSPVSPARRAERKETEDRNVIGEFSGHSTGRVSLHEPIHDQVYHDELQSISHESDQADNIADSPAAPALHDDIQLLSSMFKDDSKGDPVPEYWEKITKKAFNNKIKKEKMEELQEEYKPPENIHAFTKGPRLNSMVYREIPEFVRGKDKSLLETQHKFAAVTTPLVRAIEMVDSPEPEIDRRQLLTHLSHSLTFLGSAQFHVSMQRRELIRPHIAEKYRCLLNKEVPVTEFLLGDDAEKTIKEMKSVKDLKLRKSVFREKESGKQGYSSGGAGKKSYTDYDRKGSYSSFNKGSSKNKNPKYEKNSFQRSSTKNFKGGSRNSWYKK